MLMLNKLALVPSNKAFPYLNTSHVNVKLILQTVICTKYLDLNTSHVNVKFSKRCYKRIGGII